MVASELNYGKTLVGTGWAISLLLCTNGLRKQSSSHVDSAVKLFSQCVQVCTGL